MEKYIKFNDFLKESLKDPEFKKAYDDLAPEFELTKALIKKRLQQKMTQTDLAKKLGTKQPVISRLEQGDYNPSVKFLRRVAKALNGKLKITIS